MSVTIRQYARSSRIPRYVFYHLRDKGLIQDPLTNDNLIGLELLEKIWGQRELLRPQLAQLSIADRQRFIKTADLPTKWERYAYSRFRNHDAKTNLPMQTVVKEIEDIFGFDLNKIQKQKLYRARNRAQVDRHREKISYRNDG